MIYGAVFLALPALVYLAVALTPPGRGLAAVSAVLVLVLAALWLGWLLTLPPLFTGERATDGLTQAAVVILTIATALGLLAQGFRWVLPGRRPGWVYPTIVLLTAGAAIVPLVSVLAL